MSAESLIVRPAARPKVGDFAVLETRYSQTVLGPISKVTAQRAFHPDMWGGARESRSDIEDMLYCGDEKTARDLAAKVKSSKEARDMEIKEAGERHRDRVSAMLSQLWEAQQ